MSDSDLTPPSSDQFILTFDENDVEVVSFKSSLLASDGVLLGETKEKLAGSQNAQNFQKN